MALYYERYMQKSYAGSPSYSYKIGLDKAQRASAQEAICGRALRTLTFLGFTAHASF